MAGSNDKPRQSAGDEESGDQIGSDTPRSGIATPQPDLQDKRLPGIMSYFSQVGSSSLNFFSRTPSTSRARETEAESSAPHQEEKDANKKTALPEPLPTQDGKDSATEALPLLPHERVTPAAEAESSSQPAASHSQTNPYPTPPCSKTPSETGVRLSEVGSDAGGVSSRGSFDVGSLPQSSQKKSTSELAQMQSRRASLASPLTNVVTASTVHATHLSNPSGCVASTTTTNITPSSPSGARPPLDSAGPLSSKSVSVDRLKKLTNGAANKSGNSTPTRASSSTQPPPKPEPLSRSESDQSRSNGDVVEAASGRDTPVSEKSGGGASSGLPSQKGKLIIKILEGRGLRKSRDPYVVAVFQRNELISPGPRTFEDEDELDAPPPGVGGVPIQRQTSDSGRPMAIPMKSRQSSSTSISDQHTFRNRPKRSFTSPKWDAEALFDVVDTDMSVDVSVYDHGANGEDLLGHIDFQATKDIPVRGWFPLKGHADTMEENAPTGEIYVETIFQHTDKKHYGPEDFQILRLIGKGTFGQVYQVRKKDSNRIYAMKVLSKKVIVQKKEVAHTVGERNILVRTAMSESAFIVGLKFSFQTSGDLFLVTDYMSGGELFWHLQKEGRFDEKRAKFYIAELILAIQHLHHSDIVYRDLKPENILLDANGHIALCDFGLSKANLTKNDTTNTFCGTTEYLAPEVLLDEAGYTKMVDFWSLGVLVFEMCCGWSPFYAEDTQQMYKNIAFGKVRFPEILFDDAEELKRHPFFADVDWEALSKKLITPPFKPKLKSETDVSYFDPEFTNALGQAGSLNERAHALSTGFANSTPLSPTTQANFQGFTFVDENALDDHMGGRYDDDEMDSRRDNEWDDIDDIDLRKANNRMSGIVRTGGHDEPFGNSHFDM
ncbi:kinase-like domain-containing protein [Apiospora kogelbergensis]|uniref:kinase-like domain-containing protein n=1 Tax=Apiospora kogelbergensis TaxID=1337665 RepID=UPI00312EAE39